jgi:hypothetical protein
MRKRVSREQCHKIEDDDVERVAGGAAYREESSDGEFEETKFKKKVVVEEKDEEDLIRRISLDREHKIESFKELGMFDPFR